VVESPQGSGDDTHINTENNTMNTRFLLDLFSNLSNTYTDIDTCVYEVPVNKILLFMWKDDDGTHYETVAQIAVASGAGDNGDKDLIELFSITGEIIVDAFLDDQTIDFSEKLRLIDNPFS